MRDTHARLLDKLRAKVTKAAPAEIDGDADFEGPDERDATITRLERELEDERDNAAQLRKTIDEQSFRIEVLERSYSKQLDDARARATKAEAALEEERARTSELESLRDMLTAERDAAQKEIERTSRRERASVSFAPESGAQAARPHRSGTSAATDEDLSIDDMLAEVSIVDPRERAAARIVTNGPSAQESSDEAELEDMLSPDLVFSGKDSDDTDP